jgi:hypothetical protein
MQVVLPCLHRGEPWVAQRPRRIDDVEHPVDLVPNKEYWLWDCRAVRPDVPGKVHIAERYRFLGHEDGCVLLQSMVSGTQLKAPYAAINLASWLSRWHACRYLAHVK